MLSSGPMLGTSSPQSAIEPSGTGTRDSLNPIYYMNSFDSSIIKRRLISCSKGYEGIKYSDNRGSSWTFSNLKNGSFSKPFYTDVGNILVCGMGHGVDGIWCSQDGGKTWIQTYTTNEHYHFSNITEMNMKKHEFYSFDKYAESDGPLISTGYNYKEDENGYLYEAESNLYLFIKVPNDENDDYVYAHATFDENRFDGPDDDGYIRLIDDTDTDDLFIGHPSPSKVTVNHEYIVSGIESDAGTIKSVDGGLNWYKVSTLNSRFNISKFTDYDDENISASINTPTSTSTSYGGRDLKSLFKCNDITELCTILRRKSNNRDYKGLMLGDYFDIPTFTIDGSTYTNSDNPQSDDYQRLRVEIVGFGTYDGVGNIDSGPGILFQCKNIPFNHKINSTNPSVTTFKSMDLYTILANSSTGLENTLGITLNTVNRYIDGQWFSEKLFLPSEVEVFGEAYWSKSIYQKASISGTNNTGYNANTSIQWPIYSNYPQKRMKYFAGSRTDWWECSYATASSVSGCFCNVNRGGGASYCIANGSHGVPLAFYI